MIDVVSLAGFLRTPKAKTILAFVLPPYILGSMGATVAPLSRVAVASVRAVTVAVLFSCLLCGLALTFSVLGTISPIIFPVLLATTIAPSLCVFCILAGVFLQKTFLGLLASFKMILSPSLSLRRNLARVIALPFCSFTKDFFGIVQKVLASKSLTARFAFWVKTIGFRAVLVEVIRGKRVFIAAPCAAFEGCNHISTSLCFSLITVSRQMRDNCFSGATLAHRW